MDTLDNCSKSQFGGIADRLDLFSEGFYKYQFWSKDFYTRNCIVRNERYELILLCWEEGQKTFAHNHDGEECWVYVLDGKMSETRFILEKGKLVTDEEERLEEGSVSYMHEANAFHQLVNANKGRSMTLHLYANPIKKCTFYNESNDQFEENVLSDFSYEGVLLGTN